MTEQLTPDHGDELPVAVIGAGPIGLITALGLVQYGVPVVVFEEDDRLSLDTKAGTVLTRTLEVLHRYGALSEVLDASLRIDEIGELDRATNTPTLSVRTGDLTEDTRFPFVINIPQHHLEPVLRTALEKKAPGVLHMGHRLLGFEQADDYVELRLETPGGERTVKARHLLACDGGRSQVRDDLGITVEGRTLEERYMLVDLKVDLDVDDPRDYPYLAYFGDPEEWMILVRQPHCWRFLYPLAPGRPEPDREELAAKARRFIGDVAQLEILGTNIYNVHHRVADKWHDGRIFLMGDAAHLITPMWALGLNTGVLDASNLPWRLAWVRRGWADESLLEAYETEQAPVAVQGSGEMAEAARAYMDRRGGALEAMTDGNWGNAFTRALLGVRLDVEGSGDWSMVKSGDRPVPVAAGDRAPDLPLFGPQGPLYLHDLAADSFVALYFTDTRRRPAIPAQNSPALRHFAVSRWDAPHDSGLRDRALFDPGERVRKRFGVADDTLVLLRPDGHVAAIVPYDPNDASLDRAAQLYERITGRPVPRA
ncbi:FAD-binding monooxygenase [Streptomyces sp. Ru71]|uniref:FAD-dependent monooxygenase n=1 Tax=Streptomyces sp. Ru71 TaxID=2080746 RepID=UPI000CDDB4E9|nr:FAD-dependent monooxygenase [Streptomyces sp. Ru71]POX48171.1 FAD-binding monooxygenase [Streptomyces sp. Ru71]